MTDLETVVASNKVVIFSWVSCPFCVKAKQLFRSLVPESEITILDVDTMPNGDALHNAVIKATNHDTVPAIFVKQQFVGGFSDANALHKSGKLQEMLK